jgi:hypothetical protein
VAARHRLCPGAGDHGAHPLDGARHLEALSVDRRLCCLVAHHSGATFEAEECGHAAELGACEARIAEILERYPVDHPVHRAISRSRPTLAAAVDRTVRSLMGIGTATVW